MERKLFFANDRALVAHTPNDIQAVVDRYATASKKFSLQINIKKTEILTVDRDIFCHISLPTTIHRQRATSTVQSFQIRWQHCS